MDQVLEFQGTHMRMNFGEVVKIEDLGNHAAATVVSLGILLARTVDATPDPKRKGFYEIDDGRTVYYICVSPATGTIFLLAARASRAASHALVHMADSVRST